MICNNKEYQVLYKISGLDHGVGHPQWLLCEAKAPNYPKNKAFKDSGRYSEWPQVADAVIEAKFLLCKIYGTEQCYVTERGEALAKAEISEKFVYT